MGNVLQDVALNMEQRSILCVLNQIKSFVERSVEKKDNLYEVLNAFPGHGKTTALKKFLKENLDTESGKIGGLIVLREREQMREFETFLGQSRVLYIDSDNYYEVAESIPDYQFVLITHERLKNLALLNSRVEIFLKWKKQKRILFIDESPIFFKSFVFKVNSKMEWLDDCLKILEISTAESVMIRSYIQIMIARELLENNGLKTTALHRYLESDTYKREMEKFLRNVSKKLGDFRTVDSVNAFLFLKDLYERDNVGYLDSEIHFGDNIDHKKIICSERIDYRKLGCPILIFDGTAIFSQAIYNGEYDFKKSENRIDYRRLNIHHRKLNTSASHRKANKIVKVQEIIAKDIEKIRLERSTSPFLLPNKSEIQLYRKLGAIDEDTYKAYFEKEETEKNPINILNTVGKNYLREKNILYLTTIPNRPPEYYKKVAISLYNNSDETLNLSTVHKDKKDLNSWFADERIEHIYHEMLLSEVNQIIHRSKIRNLMSKDQIHIYIATNSHEIISRIKNMFPGHHPTYLEIEGNLSFEIEADRKAAYVAKTLKEKNSFKEVRIGSIDDGSKVKSFLNKEWKDISNREKIIERFDYYGVQIYEIATGVNGEKKEKRVKLK